MHKKITRFCFIVLMSILFFIPITTAAQTGIQIKENYQTFIDFNVYPNLKFPYRSEKFHLSIHSSNQNIQLIEKDNAVVFWVQAGVSETSGELLISIKDKEYTFPVQVSITRNLLDYSVQEDMYELSLQEKSLSCESAAAADILESFFGKEIHEDIVINDLPKSEYYNALPEELSTDTTLWGNPEKGFVGYIDSTDDIIVKQRLMTGYGVYETPISEIYQNYGLHTETYNSSHYYDGMTGESHLNYLLNKLQSGSMVQLWGDWCTREEYDDGVYNSCYNIDEPRELQWKYYDDNGKLVNHTGLNGEHAFILLGWKGDISNPSHIRVWDTDTGYHLYPTHEWMRKWKMMDYRSIIISKKDS